MGFTRLTPSKPTIAAIGGWCLAGGLELALWCDLRIAVASARMGYPERRWGVPLTDGGTQRLPRIVGMGRALDLILTGRIIDAHEALAIGLVTEVVPDGQHLTRALEMAEGIAAFPAAGDARRPAGRDRGLRPAAARGPGARGAIGPGGVRQRARGRGALCRRRGPRRRGRGRIGCRWSPRRTRGDKR